MNKYIKMKGENSIMKGNKMEREIKQVTGR
jgi:hypothetical protein